MELNDEQKRGIVDILKSVLTRAESILLIPLIVPFVAFYYYGYKISSTTDILILLSWVLVSFLSGYWVFTRTKSKGDDESLNKEDSRKLDDILSIIRLLERDINLMEQTGILGIAKSKENVKLLFNYRTQMYLFKLERVFLSAYTALGPFNEDNKIAPTVLKSTLEHLETKFSLELDYYIADLNKILSEMRNLDDKTIASIKDESNKVFTLLLDNISDLQHNDKIDYLIQVTSILGNKLSKILLNAIDEWDKIPVVI